MSAMMGATERWQTGEIVVPQRPLPDAAMTMPVQSLDRVSLSDLLRSVFGSAPRRIRS